MDAVAPTAVAAREARRHAQQTLQAIDTLLALDNSAESPAKAAPHAGPHSDSFRPVSGTPGPGAYDPQKERTQWRRHASVALHRTTSASSKKSAIIRAEHTRAVKTLGPGTYNVISADRMVKPRVRTTNFRPEKTVQASTRDEEPRRPLEVTTADKWLSRYPQPKGAVAYKSSNTTPSATTRSQRERLRRIRWEKTRHTRVGFYTVRFGLTERRLGTMGSFAMDKSATRCLRDSAKHVQAQTKRHVRAWRATSPVPDAQSAHGQKSTTASGSSKRVGTHRTVQWHRARTSALLERRDAKKRVETVESATGDAELSATSQRRDLRAHAMATQTGRDTVRCPQKSMRIVTRFTSLPKKEPVRHAPPTPPPRSLSSSTAVAYDKMMGRDESQVDANGVYLVGHGEERALARAPTSGATDHAIRPCVPIVIIRKSPRVSTPPPHPHALVLSPKFSLVEKRTCGHAFLAFETQLDRRERAKPKRFALDAEPRALQYVEADGAREKLKFPRSTRGTVDFSHMVGRDTEPPPNAIHWV